MIKKNGAGSGICGSMTSVYLYQIFVIASDGCSGPVEAPIQQRFIIDDGEFVMHEIGCVIVAYLCKL